VLGSFLFLWNGNVRVRSHDYLGNSKIMDSHTNVNKEKLKL
jgi:hypothetical protein